MKKIIFSLFFTQLTMMGSLYSQENNQVNTTANTNDLEMRRATIKAFIKQALEKNTSLEEIRNELDKRSKNTIEYQDYDQTYKETDQFEDTYFKKCSNRTYPNNAPECKIMSEKWDNLIAERTKKCGIYVNTPENLMFSDFEKYTPDIPAAMTYLDEDEITYTKELKKYSKAKQTIEAKLQELSKEREDMLNAHLKKRQDMLNSYLT